MGSSPIASNADGVTEPSSQPPSRPLNVPISPVAGSQTDPPAPSRKRTRSSASEKRKKFGREKIAKLLGREPGTIDSDDEREYWKQRLEYYTAEEARREALSPEERRREDIETHAKRFREHLKPELDHNDRQYLSHYPIFVLQTAPESRNGATCQLRGCEDRILPDQYRVAVTPGQNSSYRNTPDYYHVHCLEELLDLSSPHYLARFEPDLTKYIPDRGAQCILQEYLRQWKARIDSNNNNFPQLASASASASVSNDSHPGQSDAAPADEPAQVDQCDDSVESTEPAGSKMANAPVESTGEDEWSIADELWGKARQARIQALHATRTLRNTIDLNAASGGSNSNLDWDIKSYLPSEQDSDYDERYLLSKALSEWESDVVLATLETSRLSERGLRARDELGEEKIKQIRKYAVTEMPNYQALFLP